MSRLQKCWTWIGNSKNQKTLAFVGSGLAIVAGAFWQIYPHLFGTEEHKPPAAQQLTAMQGGVAVGNMSGGTIHVTNTQGISANDFKQLSKELGVTQSALESFFKILEQTQVAPGDLDNTLQEIAKRYKDLQTKLDSFSSDDPEVETLKRQAKEALDAGDFERAEKLLNQASEKDIRAANELQATAKKRLLSAAASRAANGALKYTQLAYVEAAAYYRQAAELVPPDESSTLATYLVFQGINLMMVGQYPEAFQVLERSLALHEKALGPDHPDVALNLIMLAMLYSNAQDKVVEAEPLYRRALAIGEKALGPDHPGLANALTNLGNLYRNQGKYAEAEPLLKRALMILEKALGPDHPQVAGILDNLAELYGDQSRYAEAEPLFQRALAIREKALGPDHPKVATILEGYAAMLKKMNRTAEAKPLESRVKAIRAKQEQEKLATKTSVP